ncbi:hypothetical protein GCM10010304_81290 [Streptomyces roseoviolaceus]
MSGRPPSEGGLDGTVAVRSDRVPEAGARTVLRRIVNLGRTASYGDAQQHLADHSMDPIPPTKIGGTLTSFTAVQRRIGPAGTSVSEWTCVLLRLVSQKRAEICMNERRVIRGISISTEERVNVKRVGLVCQADSFAGRLARQRVRPECPVQRGWSQADRGAVAMSGGDAG